MAPPKLETLIRREAAETAVEAEDGSQHVFVPPADTLDGRQLPMALSECSMRTVGVDLSATKARTACVSIEWGGGEALVAEPALQVGRVELVRRLALGDWIGVDAPFGWPNAMVQAIHGYSSAEGVWSELDKDSFRFRCTDHHIHDMVLAETGQKHWPMSVASDRLALTAWRAAQLREDGFKGSGMRFALSGADRVLEVHPPAALLLWGFSSSGYKKSRDPARREVEGQARLDLLSAVEEKAPWLGWAPNAREVCARNDDALDAMLSALVARAAALGLTKLPEPDQQELAKVEGWTHLPFKGSLPQLASSSQPS
jgi:hypothetical protein